MKITVVIPLFNRKDLIGYTLHSLLQKYHHGVELEVIVVDDGSSDGSYELVMQEYPWVKLLRNPKKGAPSARNFGLSSASYDFIHFLDSDDLVAPDFYKARIGVLLVNPDLGASYGPWLSFKGKEGYRPQDEVLAHSPYPLLDAQHTLSHLVYLLNGKYLHPSTLVFSKSKLAQIHGFDETLLVNQDVDLFFRLLVQGIPIVGLIAPQSLVREHDDHRVGRVGSKDRAKMDTIYQLRLNFIKVLQEKGLWASAQRQALGEYCFYRFVEYHSSDREMAHRFYQLSKTLFPEYKVKGGKPFQWIARILGNKNAVYIKKYISK